MKKIQMEKKPLPKKRKTNGINNSNMITLSVLNFLIRSGCLTATAPSSTPQLIASGKTTDAGWLNSDSLAYASVSQGSQLGTSNLAVFTSNNIISVEASGITIYDASSTSTTVTPVLSNNDGTVMAVASSTAFLVGKSKIAVIDKDDTLTHEIIIYENSASNQPTVVTTIANLNPRPVSLLYYETANILLAGNSVGVHSIDPTSGTTWTAIAALPADEYIEMRRDASDGASSLVFTASFTNSKLLTFDYSTPTATSPASDVDLSGNKPTALAQSSLTAVKVLVGVNYAENSKNLIYFADYTATTITSELVFSPDNGYSVLAGTMWNAPATDIFFVATDAGLAMIDTSATAPVIEDKTSSYLESGEILTSMIFFESLEYLVISGRKSDNTYGFIKKFKYTEDCHPTCLTCSEGQNQERCLTCQAGLFKYQPDPLTNVISCLTAPICQGTTDFYTHNSTFTCISKDECKTTLTYFLLDEWSDCISACSDVPTHNFLYTAESTCLTGPQCQATTDHYSQNTTNLCIDKTQCDTDSQFTVEQWKDCVADCAANGQEFSYTYSTDKTCKSASECQAMADGFTQNSTNFCIDAATCTTTDSMFIVPDWSDCTDDCSAHPSHNYTYDSNKTCLTTGYCQALADGFTKNDTNLCVTKAECTTATFFTVDEYSDCTDTCPTGEFKYAVDNTCKTGAECQAIADYYTQNTTGLCVDLTACTTADAMFVVWDIKDCVAGCPTHPTHSYLHDSNKTCLTAPQCQGLADGFTKNDTNACLTKAECDTATYLTIAPYSDCVDTCPTGLLKHTPTTDCITKAECTAVPSYSLDSLECVSGTECTTTHTRYLDDSTNDCVASCTPLSLYLEDTLKSCLNAADCIAISDRFTQNTTMQCIAKATCDSESRFTVAGWNDCVENCPTDPDFQFKYDVDKTCVSGATCQGTSGYFTKNSTFDCILKADCTTAQFYTIDEFNDCIENCPTGEYKYKPSDEYECKTVDECKTLTFYTYNDTSECISEVSCTAVGRLVVESFKDCACPFDKKYFEPSTGTCLSAEECIAKTDRYTDTASNLCVSAATCKADSKYVNEAKKDCVTSCSVPEAAPNNVIDDVDKVCITSAECQSRPDGYTQNSTSLCVTRAACVATPMKVVEDWHDCLADCASSPSHAYFDQTDACITAQQCGALSKYTKNDTNLCVSKVECTTATFFTIEEWKDCITDCPVGIAEYKIDSNKTCYTGTGCQNLPTLYTNNATMTCIDGPTCTTGGSKLLEEFSDCVVDCDTHPTHTYLLSSQNACYTGTGCQALTDGYTRNDTANLCLTQAECIAVPANAITSYNDCADSCPTTSPDGPIYSSAGLCLTQTECQTSNKFTLNATFECIDECADPKFHDMVINDCIDACPSTLYKSTGDRKCYSPAQCKALSADHWLYETEVECRQSCSLFKNEAERKCVADTLCPDAADATTSKCFNQLTVNGLQGTGSSSVTQSGERTNTGRGLVKITFEVVIQNFNNFVSQLTYTIPGARRQRRILAGNEITDFSVSPVAGDDLSYQVDFSPPTDSAFNLNVIFDKNAEGYVQPPGAEFPSLYKINADSLTYNIPAQQTTPSTSSGLYVSGVFTAIYDTFIRVVPILSPFLSMVSNLEYIAFLPQTYNRIVVYTYANMEMTDTVNNLHVNTFVDWVGELSQVIFKQFDSSLVAEDITQVCSKGLSRLCRIGLNFNFLLRRFFTFIVFVLVSSFLICSSSSGGMRVFRYGIFPNIVIGAQLLVLFSAFYNIRMLYFGRFVFIFAFIIAILSLILYLIGFLMMLITKKGSLRIYKIDLNGELFMDIFKNLMKNGRFFTRRFIIDITLVLIIVFLQKAPAAQGPLLIVLEAVNLVFSLANRPFKMTYFDWRYIIDDILFLILAFLTTLAIFIGPKSALDYLIYIVSWFIIINDVILTVLAICNSEDGEKKERRYEENKRGDRKEGYYMGEPVNTEEDRVNDTARASDPMFSHRTQGGNGFERKIKKDQMPKLEKFDEEEEKEFESRPSDSDHYPQKIELMRADNSKPQLENPPISSPRRSDRVYGNGGQDLNADTGRFNRYNQQDDRLPRARGNYHPSQDSRKSKMPYL